VALTFTQEARDDIENIHAYIAQQNLAQAHKVVALVQIAINRLTTFPGMGRIGRVEGTRELVVPRLPYVVIYTHRDDDDHDIVIQRVLHGVQQWPPP